MWNVSVKKILLKISKIFEYWVLKYMSVKYITVILHLFKIGDSNTNIST